MNGRGTSAKAGGLPVFPYWTAARRRMRRPGRVHVRFPGICAAARELGVTRVHLYLVLTGQRESRNLTARYRALMKHATSSMKDSA